MKQVFKMIGITLILITVSFFAFAQDATPISDIDAIQKIMAQLSAGGLKGMAAVIAAVQVVMILLRANFVVQKIGALNDKYRIVVVYGLSVLGGALVLNSQGMSWGAIVMHSQTIAALQVFAHQVYKQLIEKKA